MSAAFLHQHLACVHADYKFLLESLRGGLIKMNGTEQKKRLLMVGAFPPPVHGMAAVNAEAREIFRRAKIEPIIIDVAATRLDRSLAVRLARLPRVALGLLRFLFERKMMNETLYMSVSGGLGQLYEILFLIVARFHKMRLYLHHHSFAYLDRPNIITRVLTAVAGKESVHITQSPRMKTHLQGKYTAVRRAVPVSNVVFLMNSNRTRHMTRRKLKTVGFISNITEEKGIFEFLNLIDACEADGLQLQARIAGPFQDEETESRVWQRIRTLSSVQYVGPLYGEAKRNYFESIDVLVFPTLYYNETEGIVNHEAMSHGVPVIAYGRGCIPEIIPSICGLVINPGDPFEPAALAQLKKWMHNPSSYLQASRSAREQFGRALEENNGRWQNLVHEIIHGNKEGR